MKRTLIQLHYFSLGLLLALSSITPAHADDTEVFVNGDAVTPKILMILDTSLSMASKMKNDENRLTQMKAAVKKYINQAQGVHIGLMRMNQLSGAMIYPIGDLDKTVTESIKGFDRPVTANNNNAYEPANHKVIIETVTVTESHMPLRASKMIGLRFENIIIPNNRAISKAYIELFRVGVCRKNRKYIPCSSFPITIKGELIANSAEFKTTARNVSNRVSGFNSTSASVTVNISDWTRTKEVHRLGGLQPIIQEIVNQSDWQEGNSLSLILDTSKINSAQYEKIAFRSALGRYSATLFVEYKDNYVRNISTRQKMIEIIDNQKLTSHTPIVPTLYEATKYLAGANLQSTAIGDITTRRSAIERLEKDPVHERIPHPDSYLNGTVVAQSLCSDKNLNSVVCKNRQLTRGNTSKPIKYKSPITDTCSDDSTNIVLLTDGGAHHKANSQLNSNWWGKMIAEIGTYANNKSCTSVSGKNGNPQTCGEELAIKLGQGINVANVTDQQKVTLYTIGFAHNDSFLITLAKQGENTAEAKARYSTANDSDQLFKVFKGITGSIVGKTATLTNSASSISSSNRLNNNNTLYYSLFEPSDKANWLGNLKRYKINRSGKIIDTNDKIATDPNTGLFIDSAQSWWSPKADGAVVSAGGAASKLPATRHIYSNGFNQAANKITTVRLTEATKASFTISDFNVDSIDRKNSLIDRMLTAKKISDPLHSMPFEVNYSGENSLIFFGDNQGYIHAIDSETGIEKYAFIPRELLKIQQSIAENKISTNHIYGMDGQLSYWNNNGKKYLYSGMRRGGSSYYALNITNRDAPVLEWMISPTTTGFGALGQTWSKPVKTKIKFNGVIKNVLIFGGGYDPQQDNVTTKTIDPKGSAIYIVNAETGTKMWSKTDMSYSVPSNVKVISTIGHGIANQFYVGDMGGQVWRFDINQNSITSKVIASIAGTDAKSNRRFYHAPDISLLKDKRTLAIAMGSGYRAHPNNDVIKDQFYVIHQPLNAAGATVITQAGLYNATGNIIGIGDDNEKEKATKKLIGKKGWYIDLASGGEKVLGSSLTQDHTIWFSTYQPGTVIDNCTRHDSTARLYRLNISNATPSHNEVTPTTIDGSQSCDLVSCDTSDRSTKLKGVILPPEPNLLSIGDTKFIAVGTGIFPVAKRKAKYLFWRNAKS